MYDGLFWKHSDCKPLSNMPILGSSLVPIRWEKDSIRLKSLFLELGGSLRKEAPRRLNLLVKGKKYPRWDFRQQDFSNCVLPPTLIPCNLIFSALVFSLLVSISKDVKPAFCSLLIPQQNISVGWYAFSGIYIEIDFWYSPNKQKTSHWMITFFLFE